MSDNIAEDGPGFASEQAPYPKVLVDARGAAVRFRGRWRRRRARAEFEVGEDDSLGDDPSIWRRATEPDGVEVDRKLLRHAERSPETERFLTRARAAFRRLLG